MMSDKAPLTSFNLHPQPAVVGDYWSPHNRSTEELRSSVASCGVQRCFYSGHESWDSTGIPNVPPFDRKRVIIWYQKTCAVCANSGPLFDALAEAGRTDKPGFTVHRVEATPEMLVRFPHVTVVPLYDVVEPTSANPTDPKDPPYGPGTRLNTIRNDMNALVAAFPTLRSALDKTVTELQNPEPVVKP